MKIAFIGTYPPRKCGIGTFTNNLLNAIASNLPKKRISENAMVFAITDGNNEYKYPEEVKYSIRQDHQRDYINAARLINFSDAEACILEHEFGIFGGDDGAYILPFIHRLEKPLIVTFHTVLKEPSFTQKSIVEEIGKKASKIIVMSNKAINFLTEIYHIPKEQICLIEHGVPEFDHISQEDAKTRLGLSNKKLLFTFGLLSRNKGIETVLHALPAVVEKHPDIIFIVLGATHPNVLKHSGDEYRNFLIRLVNNYKLQKHVFFHNEFASEERLFEYLYASDIYITPYLNEAQITSGTLSYAVGAGSAVVSTPYWHAQELLDENRGILFEFKNNAQLSEVLLDLLDHPKKLAEIRSNAFNYGKKIRWPKIGKAYLNCVKEVVSAFEFQPKVSKHYIDLPLLPKYSMEHIKRLTDDTGIVQHAKYGIPNLKEGYCLDDNSRALLMSVMAYKQNKDQEALKLMPVYLSYIHYMQRSSGNFRNFLSFNRSFLDEHGSEDSFGRTIWALGYLLRYPPNNAFRELGKEIFFRSAPFIDQISSIRGAANTIIGISFYLKYIKEDEEMRNKMNRLVDILVQAYNSSSKPNWQWFENIMTYDNAILPLALLSAYEIDNNKDILNIALKTSEFLESKVWIDGHLCPVGNKGWLPEDGKKAEYDQQSIDVMAMILLYYRLFKVQKSSKYIERMFSSYLWFLGENTLRLPLFDHETKGSCDGLEEHGLNRNQGAESTLAYWISHLTVLATQEQEHLYIE